MNRSSSIHHTDSSTGCVTISAVHQMRPWLISVARQLIQVDLQAKFGASDVVQQTCLDAIRDLPRSGGIQRKNLCGWLMTLLRNNFRDANRAFKRRKRNVSLERHEVSEHLPSHSADPDEQLIAVEQWSQLLSVMNELPHAQQCLLHWRYVENLTHSEIALRVDRSEDAVRVMLKRTLDRLKRKLGVDESVNN